MRKLRDMEKERAVARRKYAENIEFYRKKSRDWHAANREKSRACALRWHHENKDRAAATLKAWRARNKAHVKAYRKRHEHNNPSFKMANKLRIRLSEILGYRGKKPAPVTEALIGCTVAYLKAHLQEKFQRGMTWENRGGNDGWEIDHIIPCAKFDLTKKQDVALCFHFSNLRPMWASLNKAKNRY